MTEETIKHMKTMLLLLTFSLLVAQLIASNRTQEIRGKIIDKATGEPLAGVNISLNESKNPIGTITDENGEFRLWNVPTSSQSLQLSLPGYQTTVVADPFNNNNEFPFIIEMQDTIKEKRKKIFSRLFKSNKPKNDSVLLATE